MPEHTEREPAEQAASTEPAAARSAFAGPPLASRMLALQRTAGNAAVNRLLAREERYLQVPLDEASAQALKPVGGMPDKTKFVFVVGGKDDQALALAETFYIMNHDLWTEVLTRKDFEPTIKGIFEYLANRKTKQIEEITVVVHGTGSGDLKVPLDLNDTDDMTSPAELRDAIDRGKIARLGTGQITAKTRIRLQACFGGQGAGGKNMINLLDEAFGEGAGEVISPTVEVGYSGLVTYEGITGWWVASWAPLSDADLALALKTKYSKSVGPLDPQHHRSGENAGKAMTEDEQWLKLAEEAEEQQSTTSDGTPAYVYIAHYYTQKVKPGYENDPLLYTRSDYRYSPTEL